MLSMAGLTRVFDLCQVVLPALLSQRGNGTRYRSKELAGVAISEMAGIRPEMVGIVLAL